MNGIFHLVMKSLACTAIFFAVIVRAGAQTPAAGRVHINLSSPVDYQVVQRADRSEGKLIIAGSIVSEGKSGLLPQILQARLTGKSAAGDLPGLWQELPFDPQVSAFRGSLKVPAGGWYRLEIRALWTNDVIAATADVDHVGVGDVFVIAGQSNSANYGEQRQTNVTGLVAAYSGTNWQMAADPEPGAGGTKGSFMALFGDAMVNQFHVPIGIVAMGIGSTSVREWLPAGTRLSNLPPLTRNVVTVGPGEWESAGIIFSNFTARMKSFGPQGFRAVLWHQGESDGKQANPARSLPGDLYHQDIKQLILDSRQVLGWDAPWFVAQVSYHNINDVSSPDIRAAQKALWDEGIALAGPDTDTLTGLMREKHGAGIHLSDQGLHEHARLWAKKVGPWLEQQLDRPPSSP